MIARNGSARKKQYGKVFLKLNRFDLKNPAVLAALFSGLTLCWTIGWSVYSYSYDKRIAVSQELRVKREEAYGELLTLSADASMYDKDANYFSALEEKVHPLVRGKIDLLGSPNVRSCAIELDTLVWICAHPSDERYKDWCKPWHLHILNMSLSRAARLSLANTWDQSPEQFADEDHHSEACPASAAIYQSISDAKRRSERETGTSMK
jgi:hypothetical protein